jgi:hypothetical protein
LLQIRNVRNSSENEVELSKNNQGNTEVIEETAPLITLLHTASQNEGVILKIGGQWAKVRKSKMTLSRYAILY